MIPGLSVCGRLVGTPGYIAPEIVVGEMGDVRSDIYSFGLVAHQMVTGSSEPPLVAKESTNLGEFERKTLELRREQRFPAPGSKLDGVIFNCLKFVPEDRYEDFRRLRQDLLALARTTISVPDLNSLEATAVAVEMYTVDRATMLARLGKLEEALACIRKVKEREPNNSGAWNSEGGLLTDAGQHEEALRSLDRSIELNPNWALPWHNKGRTLRILNRVDEALTCFEHASQLASHFLPPWFSQGNCLVDLGRHEDALQRFEHAISIDTNSTDAWSRKGEMLEILGRTGEAIQSLEHALVIDPENSAARDRLN